MTKTFFGLCVAPGESSLVCNESAKIEIKSLCLDKTTGKKPENQLWLVDECGRKEHLVAIVTRSNPYIKTELTFAPFEEIRFLVEGDADVHLVGTRTDEFMPIMVNKSNLKASVFKSIGDNSSSLLRTQSNDTENQWLKLSDGIRTKDLQAGIGAESKIGDEVSIFYETRLDESKEPVVNNNEKGPLKIVLGSAGFFKGWNVGIPGMKIGSKRRIECPPDFAYGKKGVPPIIPPNLKAIFDITLHDISEKDNTISDEK